MLQSILSRAADQALKEFEKKWTGVSPELSLPIDPDSYRKLVFGFWELPGDTRRKIISSFGTPTPMTTTLYHLLVEHFFQLPDEVREEIATSAGFKYEPIDLSPHKGEELEDFERRKVAFRAGVRDMFLSQAFEALDLISIAWFIGDYRQGYMGPGGFHIEDSELTRNLCIALAELAPAGSA